MWRERKGSLKLSPNMMSTDSSTSRRTMRTRTRPQSSFERKHVARRLYEISFQKLLSSDLLLYSDTKTACCTDSQASQICSHPTTCRKDFGLFTYADNTASDLISTLVVLTFSKSIDVGQALHFMLEDDNTASETYELYGPTNYSVAEIAELVDREIYKRRRHINVPKRLMQPSAKILNQLLWWKTTSADEVEREFIDQEIDATAKTFKDLGMEPGDLKNFTFHYLVCFCILCTRNRLIAWFNCTASVPEFGFLRFATSDGTRKAGGKEVSACPG